MRIFVGFLIPVTLLISAVTHIVVPFVERVEAPVYYPPGSVIDTNRPQTPQDCDQPIGLRWFGSREQCLAEMCAGQNVLNEYTFDAGNRAPHKNPCYGQRPEEYKAR